MKDYEKASVKIATSLAFLNSGQGAIFSSALTVMMYLAAKEVLAGEQCFQRLVIRLFRRLIASTMVHQAT